jgi:ribonucleoside-diphosphate reductase alpha chain
MQKTNKHNSAKRYNTIPLEEFGDAITFNKQIDISNQDTIKASEIIIIKRNGRKEPFQSEKMRNVCKWATDNRNWMVDELISDTEIKLHKEIHIKDMYQQLIHTAVNKISMLQPMWEDVAGRLYLMGIYKETYDISTAEDYPHIATVLSKGLEHKIYDRKSVNNYTSDEINEINDAVEPKRDLLFNYSSLVTFFDKYCLNYTKTKKLELPQHSYMRVALSLMINEENRIDNVIELYNAISQHHYTVATPIMLNALTPGQQLSSCVLNTVDDDSHSILDTGKNLGIYSKFKGGTALDISSIRAMGSYIGGTQGYSSGPIPFMKYYESIMKSFNQGGKRKGALAIYFNWWHLDVMDILSLKSNGGTDENRARGLQYAIKLNRHFVNAVINDEEIILFDPKDVTELIGKYGDNFTKIYKQYSSKTTIRNKKIEAREIWQKIFKERSESGSIYLFHDENVNEASLLNRYIGSSNLCLSGDTKVSMSDDSIRDLENIEVGDIVKSLNVISGKVENKIITDSALMNSSAEVMKITDENTSKSITCTPDHQIYTENRGYVMAKDLKEDDELNVV